MGHVAQNNVIPASAELRLDVRLTPGLEPGGVLEAIEALARDTERPVPRHADRDRANRAAPARDARRARRGGRQGARVGGPARERTTAGLRRRARARRTARSSAPILGIPIVTFGPGNRLIPHQVDERVPVAELVEAARAYAAAAVRYLVSCLSRTDESAAPSGRGIPGARSRTARSSACAIRAASPSPS